MINGFKPDQDLILVAQGLVSEDGENYEYDAALTDLVAGAMNISREEAYKFVHQNRKPTPSENEHVILVAVHVVGPETMKEAQESVMSDMDYVVNNTDSDVEGWWIAMDERYHGSDNDSAEFIKGSGAAARQRFLDQQDPEKWAYDTINGIVMPTHESGLETIDNLNFIITKQGEATVQDLLDLLGLAASTPHGDKFSWKGYLPALSSIVFDKETSAWKFFLPRPTKTGTYFG